MHDDVRREYKKLADRIGMPKYVVTDGASELRESVDVHGESGVAVRALQTSGRATQQRRLHQPGRRPALADNRLER